MIKEVISVINMFDSLLWALLKLILLLLGIIIVLISALGSGDSDD